MPTPRRALHPAASGSSTGGRRRGRRRPPWVPWSRRVAAPLDPRACCAELALPPLDVALAVRDPVCARLAQLREPALGHPEDHAVSSGLDPELDEGAGVRAGVG